MVIWPIEARAGNGCLEPAEEALASRVHAKGDVWLTSVSAKVAFTAENPQEKANLSRADVDHGRSLADEWGNNSALVFHRHVSRETLRSGNESTCEARAGRGNPWLQGFRLFHRHVSRETQYPGPTLVSSVHW